MAPYLPRNGASGSPYSEGGALYALGLIHANHGQDIRDFLLESLRGTSNEVRLLHLVQAAGKLDCHPELRHQGLLLILTVLYVPFCILMQSTDCAAPL